MSKRTVFWGIVTITLLGALLSGCQQLEPLMSYQGQLTDTSGNPVPDGNYQMLFRLYDDETALVGNEVYSETQTVAVAGGLFNVNLGAVNPLSPDLPFFAGKLWLGVEVEGDGEMTPRQQLTGAPYAMSLVPGAIVAGTIDSGTIPGGVLLVTNAGDGYGVGVVTTDANSTGVNVGAQGTGAIGVNIEGFADAIAVTNADYGFRIAGVDNGGIITSTVFGLKVTVSEADGSYAIMGRTESTGASAWAIRGDSDTTGGVLGRATGTGIYAVRGSNSDGLGGYFWNSSTNYYSLRAYNTQGDSAPGLHVRGTSTFTGAKTGYVADLCQNAGPEVLEPGDVVVIVGYSEAVLGEIPVILVRKASEANATGVVGIVDVRQVVNPSSQEMFSDPESTSSPEAEVHVAEGPIQQGDYLLVVTLGAYKGIKVDASGGPIRPGDLLTASSNGGYAMKATPLTVGSVTFYAPGTIIGKALGSLDEGTGIIPVFVSAR